MKKLILIVSILFCAQINAQKNTKVSSLDFIQVINNNTKEAAFYYQNNWEILRKMAIKKGYINSYQFLETKPSKETPFSYILITTYKNKTQFEQREKHFQELIKEKGELQLLNSKKSKEFRKALYRKIVTHKES